MWGRDSGRALTQGERALATGMFGDAIALDQVRLHRRKWWPLQPRNVVMAPDGAIWFHPLSELWRDDFSTAPPHLQALLLHELTHVYQAQKGGRFYLLLVRHPFCRYRYALKPGCPFEHYGIEQQAEIVRHAFMQRIGQSVPDAPPLQQLEELLPFCRSGAMGATNGHGQPPGSGRAR